MSCNSKKFLIEVCNTRKLQLKCLKCVKTAVTFTDGYGLLTSAINNSPIEFHLPGLNFTGPRTQLL